MDMRFGDPDRLTAAEPAEIDFRAFVATVAAIQASSPAARAAAGARGLVRLPPAPAPARPEDLPIADRRGAFHDVTALLLSVQSTETVLKTGFTVAFQASFKPHP